MYADVKKLRQHECKLRFSDEEEALIDAIVAYTGEQKAALLRSLVLEAAEIALANHNDRQLELEVAL